MSLQQHLATTACAVALSFGFAPDAQVFAHRLPAVPGLADQQLRLNALVTEEADILASCGGRPSPAQQQRLNVIRPQVDFLSQRINTAMADLRGISAGPSASGQHLPGNLGARSGGQLMNAGGAQGGYRAAAAPAPAPAPAPAQAKAPAKRPPSEIDPQRWGFSNFAEFVAAVKIGSAKAGQVDPRLVLNAAPNSYGSEGVGQDGGFAVPPEFRDTIIEKVLGEQSLLPLTDQQIASRNSITFPADETTPWQSSGGIQAYWESEAKEMPQSKPDLKAKTVKLEKIVALVPLSDELLEDAPAMASYVNRKAPEKITARINAAIMSGSGVGMPLGILNSPGTIVVPKEAGQAADSVLFANITKLWTSVTPPARRNARWFLNPDVEQQLLTMQFPGTGTAVPAYMPPGGLSAAPYGTLLGRPIVYSEAMAPVGEQGDIVFGDLANYLTAVKTGGVRSEVSMHLWFDYDLTAFRFVLRVGGQPWWNAPIQPASIASSKRGFFATLAARG